MKSCPRCGSQSSSDALRCSTCARPFSWGSDFAPDISARVVQGRRPLSKPMRGQRPLLAGLGVGIGGLGLLVALGVSSRGSAGQGSFPPTAYPRAANGSGLARSVAVASPTPLPPVPSPTVTPLPALTEPQAVERVLPSVVFVSVADGTGTGFVVKPGLVATNRHVVGTSTAITIRSETGPNLRGRVVYRSASEDIALVSFDDRSLPAARFGQTALLKAGEVVIAIGYPYSSRNGMQGGPTISRGLFSSIRLLNGIPYLQSGATLNPGNSGGPLITLKGEVVGMNTLGMRDADGIFFAVPSESIAAAMESF
ncbi:MAG: hypothetical protein EBT09_05655 [Actinobacteria bacterium]|nr:hypothetical protein [Actinomycetota bacterium]